MTSGAISLGKSMAELMDELGRNPGRLCLVEGAGSGRDLVRLIAQGFGDEPTSVGRVVTHDAATEAPGDVTSNFADAQFLVDLDVLFWPAMKVNPLQLLRSLSRSKPLISHWPGEITGRRATYSELGRRDYFDSTIGDAVVVRPRSVGFPDETPYTIERIPA